MQPHRTISKSFDPWFKIYENSLFLEQAPPLAILLMAHSVCSSPKPLVIAKQENRDKPVLIVLCVVG